MKYIRQPDKYSCGPTAIVNAMKWAGIDANSRELIPFLQFGCRTIDLENPEDAESNGTTDQDFDRVLRYVAKGHFKIRRRKNPRINEIIKHLKAGKAVVLSYFWGPGSLKYGHFCFLLSVERGRVVTINDHESETIRRRTFATIAKWIKNKSWDEKKGEDESPYAYFLTLEK